MTEARDGDELYSRIINGRSNHFSVSEKDLIYLLAAHATEKSPLGKVCGSFSPFLFHFCSMILPQISFPIGPIEIKTLEPVGPMR